MRKFSELEIEVLKAMSDVGQYKGRFEIWNRDTIRGIATQERVGETLSNLFIDGFLFRMPGNPNVPYYYALSANGKDFLDEL